MTSVAAMMTLLASAGCSIVVAPPVEARAAEPPKIVFEAGSETVRKISALRPSHDELSADSIASNGRIALSGWPSLRLAKYTEFVDRNDELRDRFGKGQFHASVEQLWLARESERTSQTGELLQVGEGMMVRVRDRSGTYGEKILSRGDHPLQVDAAGLAGRIVFLAVNALGANSNEVTATIFVEARGRLTVETANQLSVQLWKRVKTRRVTVAIRPDELFLDAWYPWKNPFVPAVPRRPGVERTSSAFYCDLSPEPACIELTGI